MISLLLFFNLMAQDVLVQKTTTPDVLFEKQLIENPGFQSFTQFSQQKNIPLESELKNLFKRAQFEFLQGSLEKATLLFEDIGEMQHKAIWAESSQKLIHYSLLRVAQLKKSETDLWLKKATVFNPNLKIDPQLFPPPFVENFQKIRSLNKTKIWPLPQQAEQFNLILINGRNHGRSTRFLRYPSGTVRVDFLSNKFQPVSMVIDLNGTESLKLATHPIAEGSCQNPSFLLTGEHKAQFHLVDENCVSRPNARLAHNSKHQWDKEPSPKKQAPSVMKNKWFWIGASVLATGLTLHTLNQQKSQGGPSAPASKSTQEFSNQ